VTVTLSAAVVPRLPDGRVLVGTRTLQARSFPGYLAFPGGATDDGDEELPRSSGETVEARERGAALRELGEESGRWLLCAADGSPADVTALERFAEGLRRGDPLAHVLAATSLILDDRRLRPLGRWVTPDFLPHRFDVRQFLLNLDDDAPALSVPTTELEGLSWRHPSEVAADWRAADALLVPPIRFVVERLAAAERAGDDLDALVGRLSAVPGEDEPELRDVVEGVAIQPYRTPTLPPAQHTNTILLGVDDFLIVDPATPYEDERARFDALLASLAARGRSPRAIVLTHHHNDHVGDVERLVAKHGLPVWAHAETRAHVDFAIDRFLDDGELLETGGDPARAFRVLYTPGHAHGHLCFVEEATGLAVVGDLVASIGSILIDPPEGHMGTYLRSLQRVLEAGVRRVVPAHGPLLADGPGRLRAQLSHREARHQAVLAALRSEGEGDTPLDLVPGVYGADTPEMMFPLAARSVLAALELLVERGQAERRDDRFRRVVVSSQ
jgi:glyoxylase-like metal-dependent hydrolase (beta-lactamase superfamily II)/8-oxo-dGTP pyrophosphatase MutT (NUDIX family)